MVQNVGWCVVVTKPMSEHIAAQSIRQAGYREYLPMEQRILRGHRESKGQPKLYPLFPRYMFAELHPDQAYWPLSKANGVAHLLMRGDRPALVRPGIIEAIQQAENEGQFDERRKAEEAMLPVGSLVRVMEGPFSDMIGRIVDAKGDGRIRVVLEMLGRPTPTDMHAKQVVMA